MDSKVIGKVPPLAFVVAFALAWCIAALPGQALAQDGAARLEAGAVSASAGEADELYLDGDKYEIANTEFDRVVPGHIIDLKAGGATVGDTMVTVYSGNDWGDPYDALVISDKQYTGVQVRPEVEVMIPSEEVSDETILLRPGVDYTLSYGPNVSGMGTVTATGINCFKGSVTQTFNIIGAGEAALSLADAQIAPIPARTYTGKAIEPAPAVSLGGKALVAGRDYSLSYKSNKSAGKAEVTVTGIAPYTGSRTASFTISKAGISKAKVSSIGKKKRTGKAVKPKPTVKFGGKKLKLNRDYTLSYKNNVKAGKATVTVKGKGNFTGSKKVKFRIVG